MHRLLISAVVFGLATIIANAQTPMETQISPKDVVRQFYKMETEGRWLGPERWDELQDFLADVGPWSRPGSISVLRNYDVGDARKHIGYRGTVDYQVEVDYFEWGSIDNFLNFTRARGPQGESPATHEPVEQRTYQTIYLSDKFVKRSASEDKEETGALRWRISSPVVPEVDVDAALQWVAERRDKSEDPALKYNAERTIAILKSLSTAAPTPPQPNGAVKESPFEVGKRFVDLESNSTPDEWNKLTEFFVETPKPQWNRVHLVDIVGIGADINGDSGFFTLLTNALGDLDSSMHLSGYPSMRVPLATPSASACFGDDRFGFSLLLSDKHWEIAKDSTVKELDGPLAWRIEDTSFEPLITLDTAIRYARQARDKTTDPVVKSNATRTLTILTYYKEGKPLPDELSSSAGGGCG